MNLEEQEKELINKLSMFRDAFKAQTIDLKCSIRRDLVAAELKDILVSNADFHSLKNAIEEYIKSLIDLSKIETEEIENDKPR